MKPLYVLDTGALLAYVHGVDVIGQLLADVADVGETVAVPSTCLLEAYGLLRFDDEFEMLALLRGHPAVQTVSPRQDVHAADDLPFIGGMAKRAGRLGAGHAAFVAMTNTAAVYTSRVEEIRAVLSREWLVFEV